MEHDYQAALERLGFESLRLGQREALDTLYATGRLLLVAPTGAARA